MMQEAQAPFFTDQNFLTMRTILSLHKADTNDNGLRIAGMQDSTYPLHEELNITDGSEFLDDAIRTKDQPLEKNRCEEKSTTLSKPFHSYYL
jgi:hypothetical protein